MATKLNNPNEEQVFVHVQVETVQQESVQRTCVALIQISLLYSIHYLTVCDVTGLPEI